MTFEGLQTRIMYELLEAQDNPEKVVTPQIENIMKHIGKYKAELLESVEREVIGEYEEIQEGRVMATPFNAIVLGKNELRAQQHKKIAELKGKNE